MPKIDRIDFDESVPYVELLQRKLSTSTGYSAVLLSSSGLSALEAALFSKGISNSQRVYCDVLFPFGIMAAQAFGAIVTPVDISAETLTMDPSKLDRLAQRYGEGVVISTATFGNTPDTMALSDICERHGLGYIEDHAQSFGVLTEKRTTAVTLCTSFQSGKFYGCGQGGAIFCDNENEVIQAGRYLSLGWYPRRGDDGTINYQDSWKQRVAGGRSARMADIVACLLSKKIHQTECRANLQARRDKTEKLINNLMVTFPECEIQNFSKNSTDLRWRTVVIAPTKERANCVYNRLRNLGSRAYLLPPLPASDWPAYKIEGNLPVTQALGDKVVCLPTMSLLDCEHELSCLEGITG